jgi:hypothetical protein
MSGPSEDEAPASAPIPLEYARPARGMTDVGGQAWTSLWVGVGGIGLGGLFSSEIPTALCLLGFFLGLRVLRQRNIRADQRAVACVSLLVNGPVSGLWILGLLAVLGILG